MEIIGLLLVLIGGFCFGFWSCVKIWSFDDKPKENPIKEFDASLLLEVFNRYRNKILKEEIYEELPTVDQIIDSLKKGTHTPSIDQYQVNCIVLNMNQFGQSHSAFYVTKKAA